MDEEKLYSNEDDYLISLRGTKAKLICIPNYEHNQVLYAAGTKHNDFGESIVNQCSAVLMCRRLSGLDRFGKVIIAKGVE